MTTNPGGADGSAHEGAGGGTGASSQPAGSRYQGGRLAPWLHGAGIVIVGYTLGTWAYPGNLPQWGIAAGVVALAGWAGAVLVPARRRVALRIAYLAAALGGALGASATNGLLMAPAIVGLMYATMSVAEPLWVGGSLAVASGGVAAVGVVISGDATVGDLAELAAGVLIGFLGGMNRRQGRQRDRQRLELAERVADVRAERARLSALSARQDAARDLHDVLAHSLGALVIQLDATEALLEAGRIDLAGARTRVAAARDLAASGLGEARQAVDVLRRPGTDPRPVPVAVLHDELEVLLATHRHLGGTVELTEEAGDPPRERLPEDVATAVRRAVQEGLSNARKHAPGAPVAVRMRWTPGRVGLELRNRLVAPERRGGLSASGGGQGMRGMAERFARLPGGSVRAGQRDGEFVVEAVADVPDAVVPAADPPEAVVPGADVPDAVVPDAVVPEAVVPDADQPEADGPGRVGSERKGSGS